jgi:hypothetical protein
MATVADLAVNSLNSWMDRDMEEVLAYIVDLERGLKLLRAKVESNNRDLTESSLDSIQSDSAHLRDYFIKYLVAFKAVRMINFHLDEERNSTCTK